MKEDRIKQYLLEILEDLYSNRISNRMAIDRLESNTDLIEQVVEEEVCFLVSDCFWTIRHLEEEDITNNEIAYFIECLKSKKDYDLEEKNKLILTEYQKNK